MLHHNDFKTRKGKRNMGQNRRLKIVISNDPAREGCMNLDFAISHFGENFPEESTTITIYEVLSDNTEKKLFERRNGEWIDFSIE